MPSLRAQKLVETTTLSSSINHQTSHLSTITSRSVHSTLSKHSWKERAIQSLDVWGSFIVYRYTAPKVSQTIVPKAMQLRAKHTVSSIRPHQVSIGRQVIKANATSPNLNHAAYAWKWAVGGDRKCLPRCQLYQRFSIIYTKLYLNSTISDRNHGARCRTVDLKDFCPLLESEIIPVERMSPKKTLENMNSPPII